MPQAAPPPNNDPKEYAQGQLVAFPRFQGEGEQRPSPHNLPLELSSFVGRQREIAEVRRLLGDHRLLTLTGPGGCGKTRLALVVASKVAERFEDGVWLVELASLSDPDLVGQAVASTLCVREVPGHSLTETLSDQFRSKEMLLVLDNCEHLLDGCAALVDALLRTCPSLRILATSREALGIAGESAWLVPSLSLPGSESLPPFEELRRYEALQLFVERAAATSSGFELTERNAPAVAVICQRLDGLPLAIELAAPQVRVLSVEQIASRLEDSCGLLRSGSRTALPRHRTLRATIEWSHELLGQEERVLFRRLSVFSGGFTLEAAEEVCSGEGLEPEDMLDLLSHLADKSLVEVSEGAGESRYRLLEPVRQYAAEKLERSGEAAEIRRAHAGFMLKLAEEAEPELKGTQQAAWLERLETEHDNLRAALGWTLERGEKDLGLRLGGALGEFWYTRGHLSEGRRWLEAALANGGETSEPARAKALARAGWMAWEQGEYERSVALSGESLALSRKIGDQASAALALFTLGLAQMHRGELERAWALIEEVVTLQRALGDTAGLARSLAALGNILMFRQDFERAAALHEESLALAREAADAFAINVSLLLGARVYLGRGEQQRARALCEEGLALAWRLRMMHATAAHLRVATALAASGGQPVRSARLWGAAEALREAIGAALTPVARSYYAPHTAAALAELGEASWEAAWSEGRAMTLQQAVEYALGSPSPATPQPKNVILSPREVEVLALVAEGLTDRQVAERLYLSPRTVGRHLGSIYNKLGVSSRAAAVKQALERNLI